MATHAPENQPPRGDGTGARRARLARLAGEASERTEVTA